MLAQPSPLNVAVFANAPYDSAPGGRFRIEQWARLIGAENARFRFCALESPALHSVLYMPGRVPEKAVHMTIRSLARLADLALGCFKADVFFVFREMLPVGPPLLECAFSRLRVPMVYDFDDAIFLPSVSEANRRFQWLKSPPEKVGRICSYADHVTVGNEHLREYASRFSKSVTVIPTTIDTDLYRPKDSTAIRGIPKIGWSGSPTTAAHLKTILPALRNLARTLPFRLAVVGSAGFEADGVDIESKGWSAVTEINDIRSFDIGVMPLPDDAWAKGKCGLKALQYMALGVPTIASPVGVNTDIIEDGVNGFLASTPSEWVEKLSRLIADKELRRVFAHNARMTVERRFSGRSQAPRILQVLRDAAGRRQPAAVSAKLVS